MAQQVPSIGRIVHYRLSAHDTDVINASRRQALDFAQKHGLRIPIFNSVYQGDAFPATIVRVWGDTPQAAVNLKVQLDGQDDLWVTSRVCGEQNGMWLWPPFVPPVKEG